MAASLVLDDGIKKHRIVTQEHMEKDIEKAMKSIAKKLDEMEAANVKREKAAIKRHNEQMLRLGG